MPVMLLARITVPPPAPLSRRLVARLMALLMAKAPELIWAITAPSPAKVIAYRMTFSPRRRIVIVPSAGADRVWGGA